MVLNLVGAWGVFAAALCLSSPTASTWSVLVQPNKRWVLHNTFNEERDQVIIVETYDVHEVSGTKVARLRWTAKDKEKAKDGSEIGSEDGPCFTRLAANERGLFILKDAMDDAAIAKTLQGKPSRSEPPRPYEGTKKNQGRYLHVYTQKDGPVICLGEGPEPGAGECDDVCFAEFCLTPTKGVVQVSGTVVPGSGAYSQTGFSMQWN